MLDAFYVHLSPASLQAVADSRLQVISAWRAGFSSLGATVKGPKKGKLRIFKVASRAAKSAVLAGKKKVKTVPKKVRAGPARALQKPAASIEPTIQNFKRSRLGFQLIRQELESLLKLDKVKFSKQPAFDPESGICRLKIVGYS